jgi:hypothetical protein
MNTQQIAELRLLRSSGGTREQNRENLYMEMFIELNSQISLLADAVAGLGKSLEALKESTDGR